MTYFRFVYISLFLLFLQGCSHKNCPQKPPYIYLTVSAVEDYYEEGEYLHQVSNKIEEAKQYIKNRLANKKPQEKLAIVFDIDDTCISLYPIQKEISFGYTKEFFEEHEKEDTLPAIKPVLNLYNYVKSQHIAIFFISARPEYMRSYTLRNLKKVGYSEWQHDYFFKAEDRYKTIEAFKTDKRKAIEQQGYTVILTVGDQESDMVGGYSEKGIKLPNHVYLIQ